jgi:transposase
VRFRRSESALTRRFTFYLSNTAATKKHRTPLAYTLATTEFRKSCQKRFLDELTKQDLFALNRRILKAYLLKESLGQLWNYPYEGAMMRYLQSWIDQLRWQRLRPMEKLADMLIDHLDGILNYYRTKVPMGVIEAVNGNIKALLRRGRGYQDMNYLLLKAQRLGATKSEFLVLHNAA